jgi:hypothetical protein
MKSILDPSFRYTSSSNTDLRKTFARIRREQRRVAQARSDAAAMGKVLALRSLRRAGP